MTARYKKIYIRKSNGKTRVIHEPDPELKIKQRQLLHHLYATGEGPGPYAFGFVLKKGIKEHASAHVGRQYIVRIDIEDFFPSVTPKHIEEAWEFDGLLPREIEGRCRKIPLKAKEAEVMPPLGLIQYAFIQNPRNPEQLGLPQGSPLSPALANLAMKRVDFTIASLLRKWGPKDARYTRYADDLIISSDEPAIIVMAKPIRKILKRFGFKENRRKFRVMRKSGRQAVCGVVVNERLNISKDKRKEYRGRLHRLIRMGLDLTDKDGQPVNVEDLRGEYRHIEGYFSHARNVAPEYYQKYEGRLRVLRDIFEPTRNQQ